MVQISKRKSVKIIQYNFHLTTDAVGVMFVRIEVVSGQMAFIMLSSSSYNCKIIPNKDIVPV